ncbi:MAG: hypothetical protein ACFFDE_06770 [Promethearchaeota archaeon]
MRRRILSTLFLILLVALPLLPPLFGVPSAAPAVVSGGPVVPAENDLNATDPIIAYEYFTPDTPYGNSSLLNVTVEEVVASDIGICRDGDLLLHKFGVYFDENNSIVFEDDLQYIDGTGWAVQNYSLFPSNEKEGQKASWFTENGASTCSVHVSFTRSVKYIFSQVLK